MTRDLLITWCFVTAAVVSSTPASAQTAAVGQPAPPFSLTDCQGRRQSLADCKGKIVVLHFQSSTCPWDAAYQPILNRLARKFVKTRADGTVEERVRFLAINANHSETVEQIKAYAARRAIPYPILKDDSNRVADLYAATTTPHIFVIDDDEQQTLAYKGGIEKAPLSPPNCGKSRQQYLETVLWALLDGATPPFTETRNTGCSIKRVDKTALGR